MRKLLFFFAILVTNVIMAQAPQGLNYQAVVRSASGTLMTNESVTFKMSIIKNTAASEAVYAETHTVQTDDLGQVNFVIGQGTPVLSTFNTVDWASGNSYLKIELNTGSGYVDMGTTQFMSVPYALFAGSSANQLPNGTEPGQMLYWNGSQWVNVAPGANGQNLTFCSGVPTWGPCPGLMQMAVPGNHQGWDPPTAPRIGSPANSQAFEGYMYLNGGFKFVASNEQFQYVWGNTQYGDDGTFSGVLKKAPGEIDCTTAPGYYRVSANTQTMTYSLLPITTWGIIGAATPGGWDFSTPLTYNEQNMKWEATLTLTAGEFKFRANNAWDVNLGQDGAAPELLTYGGINLVIDTAGTYFVSLDFTHANYYTYTATLQ